MTEKKQFSYIRMIDEAKEFHLLVELNVLSSLADMKMGLPPYMIL